MSSEIICHDITKSRVKIAQPHEQSDHHSFPAGPCVSVEMATHRSRFHLHARGNGLPALSSSATRASCLPRPSSPQEDGRDSLSFAQDPDPSAAAPPRRRALPIHLRRLLAPTPPRAPAPRPTQPRSVHLDARGAEPVVRLLLARGG
jgi:hypothetical protein